MATRTTSKIRVRFRKGVFEPLEPVDLPEETEAEVTVGPTFFDLIDEARANIEASGVTDEELDQIITEACEEARKRTWERWQKEAGGAA